MTLDFLFLVFLLGVTFLVLVWDAFWDDPEDAGGFPPKKDRMSIGVVLYSIDVKFNRESTGRDRRELWHIGNNPKSRDLTHIGIDSRNWVQCQDNSAGLENRDKKINSLETTWFRVKGNHEAQSPRDRQASTCSSRLACAKETRKWSPIEPSWGNCAHCSSAPRAR